MRGLIVLLCGRYELGGPEVVVAERNMISIRRGNDRNVHRRIRRMG